MTKLRTIDALARSYWGSRRVVLAHGAFDILHIAHVRHLRAASKLGEVLVVSVTPDEFVRKGPNRPVFGQNDRLEMLEALEVVDYVTLNQWPTAVDLIKEIRPKIYAKGNDTIITPLFQKEIEAIESVGGRVVYTDETTFHTTNIIAELVK